MNCPICKKKVKIATWHDMVKVGNKCHIITAQVKYNGKDKSFILDDLINSEVAKIPGFNEETDELMLFSFDEDKFTQEDIKEMKFGIEDIGARCNHCNSFL